MKKLLMISLACNIVLAGTIVGMTQTTKAQSPDVSSLSDAELWYYATGQKVTPPRSLTPSERANLVARAAPKYHEATAAAATASKPAGISATGTWTDHVTTQQAMDKVESGTTLITSGEADAWYNRDENTFSIAEWATGGMGREEHRNDVRGETYRYANAVMNPEYVKASVQLLEQERDQLAQKIQSGQATVSDTARYYKIQDQLVEYYTDGGKVRDPAVIRKAAGTDNYVPLDQRIEEMAQDCDKEDPNYDPNICDPSMLAACEKADESPVLPDSAEVRARAFENMGGGGQTNTRTGISDGTASVDGLTDNAKGDNVINPTQSTAIRNGAKAVKAAYLAAHPGDEVGANAAAVQYARQMIEQIDHDNEHAMDNLSARLRAQAEADRAVQQAADRAAGQKLVSDVINSLNNTELYEVHDIVNGKEVTTNVAPAGLTQEIDIQQRY